MNGTNAEVVAKLEVVAAKMDEVLALMKQLIEAIGAQAKGGGLGH